MKETKITKKMIENYNNLLTVNHDKTRVAKIRVITNVFYGRNKNIINMQQTFKKQYSKVKASTYNIYADYINQFLQYLKDKKVIDDGIKGIKKVRITNSGKRALTVGEYNKILRNCNNNYKTAVMLQYKLALRIAELESLTYEQLQQSIIIINNKGRQRELSISDEVKDIARGKYGKVIKSKASYSTYLKRLSNKIGIDFSSHSFRHKRATDLHENNVDLVTIRDILGHGNIATTNDYLHCSKDKIKSAMAL